MAKRAMYLDHVYGKVTILWRWRTSSSVSEPSDASASALTNWLPSPRCAARPSRTFTCGASRLGPLEFALPPFEMSASGLDPGTRRVRGRPVNQLFCLSSLCSDAGEVGLYESHTSDSGDDIGEPPLRTGVCHCGSGDGGRLRTSMSGSSWS